MFNPKFSIGYNSDFPNFIAILTKYKENIDSVYFPPPKKILGSGRIVNESPRHKDEIVSLIKKCHNLKITPFMILNSTLVSPKQVFNIIDYLKHLQKNGLNHVTVTDPYLIMQIKKEFPEIFIEASTLCRIKNVDEAKYFKEIGVDRFTSDRETIRDLKLLKKLIKIMPIKVLANEGCIKNCIYKYSHYNALSANNDDIPTLPFGKKYAKIKKATAEMDSLCVFTVSRHPYKVFSSPFIRPEDLKRYEGITDVFKLSTRNFNTKKVELVLNAYIEQKYDGNLVDILNSAYINEVFEFIDNSALNQVFFFEKLQNCDDDCDKCAFCKKLLERTSARIRKIKN